MRRDRRLNNAWPLGSRRLLRRRRDCAAHLLGRIGRHWQASRAGYFAQNSPQGGVGYRPLAREPRGEVRWVLKRCFGDRSNLQGQPSVHSSQRTRFDGPVQCDGFRGNRSVRERDHCGQVFIRRPADPHGALAPRPCGMRPGQWIPQPHGLAFLSRPSAWSVRRNVFVIRWYRSSASAFAGARANCPSMRSSSTSNAATRRMREHCASLHASGPPKSDTWSSRRSRKRRAQGDRPSMRSMNSERPLVTALRLNSGLGARLERSAGPFMCSMAQQLFV
jgi:hypothetical protein